MHCWQTIVFENDFGVQESLKELLQIRKHSYLFFNSPKSVPFLYRHSCICSPGKRCADFLIINMNLPNFYALDWLKGQVEMKCKIPNIAVFGDNCSDGEKQEVRDLGCTFFPDPFNLSDLNQWLAYNELRLTMNEKYTEWRYPAEIKKYYWKNR